jgi:hypothetical protein
MGRHHHLLKCIPSCVLEFFNLFFSSKIHSHMEVPSSKRPRCDGAEAPAGVGGTDGRGSRLPTEAEEAETRLRAQLLARMAARVQKPTVAAPSSSSSSAKGPARMDVESPPTPRGPARMDVESPPTPRGLNQTPRMSILSRLPLCEPMVAGVLMRLPFSSLSLSPSLQRHREELKARQRQPR